MSLILNIFINYQSNNNNNYNDNNLNENNYINNLNIYKNDYSMLEIRNKLLNDLRKKGWTGLRQFKMYLRSLKGYTTNYIEKTEFKYYSYKFGYNFEFDLIINALVIM